MKNYKNINQKFLNENFSEIKNYSIPYLWGSIGIIYNKNLVNKPITSWRDLWRNDLSNSILLSNEPIDVMALALKSLGYSANSKNKEELKKAQEELIKLFPNIKDISSSNLLSYFVTNGFKAGMLFNGDAKLITDNSNDFEFIYPKEGALKWADGIVILKKSNNKDLSYKFIDFIIDGKNSAKIAMKTNYAISNTSGSKYLNEKTLKNNIIYPNQEQLFNSEIITYNEEIYNDTLEYFNNFKEEYKKLRKLDNEK